MESQGNSIDVAGEAATSSPLLQHTRAAYVAELSVESSESTPW
jgi:hypothetical protein